MTNQMVHVSGSTTSLFPADGGQIRTEKIQFIQGIYLSLCFCTLLLFLQRETVCFSFPLFFCLRSGKAAVQITVLKDGHHFVVHVIDPKEDPFAVEEPILDESSSSATNTHSGSEKEKAEVESSEKEGN